MCLISFPAPSLTSRPWGGVLAAVRCGKRRREQTQGERDNDANGTAPHDRFPRLASCQPSSYYVKPNAGAHLLPEAGARHERTLEAVRCSAWFM